MSISSKGFLSINSRDMTGDSIVVDARYQNFNLTFNNVKGLGACKVQFSDANSVNITPHNNKIYWEDISMSYEATVPIGSYTAASFAVALTIVMSAITPGTTVTEAAGIFTIGSPTAIKFIIPRNPDSTIFYNGKLIPDMLFITIDGPLTLNHIGSQIAELFYSSYCDITSSDLHQGSKISDSDTNKKNSNIVHRVYFIDPTNPAGRKILEHVTNIKWINTDLPSGSSFEIVLKDEYGNRYYDPDNKVKYSILIMLT